MSINPKAVFWDMDGTLVDSEPLHDAALEHAIRSLGLTPPEDLHERILGQAAWPVYQMMRAELGVSIPFEDWIARKYDYYFEHAPKLKPREGAVEIFRALEAAGIKQAIVSNSDRLIVDANLRAVGLSRNGFISVSRNDVRLGKPDPEPFLRAAYLHGVEPQDCAVMEDSQTGASAGVAAGMTTIFWPQMDLEPPAGALYFRTAEEVRAALLGD